LSYFACGAFVFATSLFFSSCADHLGLHSFPTRRSSDLVDGSQWQRHPLVQPIHHAAEVGFNTGAIHQHRTDNHHLHPGILCNLRSEEHTSELQSRENLVCRLLLEKKKNKRKNTAIPKSY